MHITINSQLFAQKLRLLNKIVANKPPIPVLANVLFRAEDQLYMATTDLEVAISTTCQATIHQTGAITLPAKKLLEMIEQLTDGDVNIEDTKLSSGAFKSRLQTLPAADFPTLPSVSGDVVTLSSQSLRLLIERTAYAVTNQTQKYFLNGALLSLSEVMAMVATDGKRLSLATAAITDKATESATAADSEISVTIPTKTLDVLLSQTTQGDIRFSRGERHLFFESDDCLLISRMLDGEFTNYKRVIPKKEASDKQVIVERIPFEAVLRRVGLVAESVCMALEGNVMLLTSKSAEIGDADEQISISYDGPPLKIHLNWKFVLDFLEKVTEPSVTMTIKNEVSAVLFTAGTDFLNVIMPMRM